TPVKLFDGSYHGGLSEDGSLAVTGARLLRANINGKDTVWYNGEQACNASLSKDSTKRTLFLDFGSETGKAFVGKNYATHERLLFADSTGKLIQSIAAPTNYTFDHSEWSNVKNVAVATVTNNNGAHSAIYLMSTADSLLLKVAEGDELWHPCLWVNKNILAINSDLNQDSAGIYFLPGGSWISEVMRIKMELFWKMKDTVNYAFVGSSRVEDGLDPVVFSKGSSLNMGHPGNDLNASLHIAKNYFMNHASQLKGVVVSLDIDLWQNTDEYTQELLNSAPGYRYDERHRFWIDGLPDIYVDLVENSYGSSEAVTTFYNSRNGYAYNTSSETWGNQPNIESDSSWADKDTSLIAWNLNLLDSFLQLAQTKNIYVIGILFPQSPGYQNTGSYGRYGPRRTVALEVIDKLNILQRKYPHFVLMDENKMGQHDYTDEMALNYDHLNYLGAAKLTARLDSLLKTLE
ncbi:MAG: TIGR02171 family protein, partial [Fibrobacteraceae bacterium]